MLMCRRKWAIVRSLCAWEGMPQRGMIYMASKHLVDRTWAQTRRAVTTSSDVTIMGGAEIQQRSAFPESVSHEQKVEHIMCVAQTLPDECQTKVICNISDMLANKHKLNTTWTKKPLKVRLKVSSKPLH